MTHLAEYFRNERLKKKLRLGQVARMVGYKNVSKGSRRVETFEQTGHVRRELLDKLATALGIDAATVNSLVEEDRLVWQAWASTPIRPYIVVRAMATVYCPVRIPDDVRSVEEAEEYAAGVARQKRMQVCLVLSRRLSVWFAADGTIEQVTEGVADDEPNQPFTVIGGRRCLLRPTEHGIAIENIDWFKKGTVR